MISWKKHPEMENFLKEIIPGHDEHFIRAAFEEKYGITLTKSQIKNFKVLRNVPSGTVGGRFEKGHISHNKGKKLSPERYEKAKATMFHKGNIPVNHREVGSERMNVDGYIEIKVAEPNKWALKHRIMYEKYHNVKLTSNDAIVFLDQNHRNFSEDNLFRLTRAELARYNQDKLYRDDADISLSAAAIAKLKTKVFETKKNR